MKVDFNNARILITGWTGSWGNELTKQLIEQYTPKEVTQIQTFYEKQYLEKNKKITYLRFSFTSL